MKHITTLLTLFAFVSCAFAQQEPKVLFIGIDGVRSDALIQANTPNLDELMAGGLYTYDSWHLGVTVSAPSWSTMLTGVWEAKHNIYNNSYTGSNYDEYPYFPTRAKEYKPDLKAVEVTSWGPMSDVSNGGSVYNSGWDQAILVPTDDVILSTAQNQLLDPDLDILFVHFDDVDAVGHGNGFAPDISIYMNQIEYIDNQIGQLLNSLYSRVNYANEDWLILLTTDHGGIGFGHGGNTDTERHIWWIASGPSLPNGVQITGSDPGSYMLGNADEAAIDEVPVLTDIAVTALDHILKDLNVDPEAETAWDLDGKSWLDFNTFIEGNNADEGAFEVYPNPNNGVFTVVFPAKAGDVSTCALSDLSGRVVWTDQVVATGKRTPLPFDLSAFNAGQYILSLQTADQLLTRKVVIR